MITPRYCQVMAAYTRHMNGQLMEICAQLDDVELRRARGAFFGSIYGTVGAPGIGIVGGGTGA